MEVKEIGTWLLHCHVNDHMTGGMEGTYTVFDPLATGMFCLVNFVIDLSERNIDLVFCFVNEISGCRIVQKRMFLVVIYFWFPCVQTLSCIH